MLERFYDPSSGKITLDGIDLKSLNVKWLRQQIGYVKTIVGSIMYLRFHYLTIFSCMHGSQSEILKRHFFLLLSCFIFFRLVSQEPKLFAMSIKDNIKIGRPSATFEEIVEAAKKSNAHDFIESFAEGKLCFLLVSVPCYPV